MATTTISLKQQMRQQADALAADFWAAAKESASPERRLIVQQATETLIAAPVLAMVATTPDERGEYQVAVENAMASLRNIKTAAGLDGATLMNNVVRKRIREGIAVAVFLANLGLK